MHENDLAKLATAHATDGSARGAVSADPSWATRNARRQELIDLGLKRGLTPAETAELWRLQEECDRHLDALAPLPFDALERVKDCARREGLLAPTSPEE